MGPYGDWDEFVVGDHAMIRDGDRFKLWHVGINHGARGYRNEFGYAESKDGLHWRKCRLNPILTQGEPGTWDGGWIYAAGVVKIDDEQLGSHVYAGKPGASYHLFNAGYPGVEYPTHRVTISTDGKPISALRLVFPGGVDLKQVRIRELNIQPLPTEETPRTHLPLSGKD